MIWQVSCPSRKFCNLSRSSLVAQSSAKLNKFDPLSYASCFCKWNISSNYEYFQVLWVPNIFKGARNETPSPLSGWSSINCARDMLSSGDVLISISWQVGECVEQGWTRRQSTQTPQDCDLFKKFSRCSNNMKFDYPCLSVSCTWSRCASNILSFSFCSKRISKFWIFVSASAASACSFFWSDSISICIFITSYVLNLKSWSGETGFRCPGLWLAIWDSQDSSTILQAFEQATDLFLMAQQCQVLLKTIDFFTLIDRLTRHRCCWNQTTSERCTNLEPIRRPIKTNEPRTICVLLFHTHSLPFHVGLEPYVAPFQQAVWNFQWFWTTQNAQTKKPHQLPVVQRAKHPTSKYAQLQRKQSKQSWTVHLNEKWSRQSVGSSSWVTVPSCHNTTSR